MVVFSLFFIAADGGPLLLLQMKEWKMNQELK
jgi:hypothetical protein